MDTCTYTHSITYKEKDQWIEKKRQISAREYMKLLENADKSMKVLYKKRQCFLYNKTYMIVDTFVNVDGCPSLLRILSEDEETTDVEIPSVFEVVRDVTDEKDYSNYQMAQTNWKMPADDIATMAEDSSSGKDSKKAAAQDKEEVKEEKKLVRKKEGNKKGEKHKGLSGAPPPLEL